MSKTQEIIQYVEQYAPELKITEQQIKEWMKKNPVLAQNLTGRILGNNVIREFQNKQSLSEMQSSKAILIGCVDSHYQMGKEKVDAVFYDIEKKDFFIAQWWGSLPKNTRKKFTAVPIGQLLKVKTQWVESESKGNTYKNLYAQDFTVLTEEKPEIPIVNTDLDGINGETIPFSYCGPMQYIKPFTKRLWNDNTRQFDEGATYPILYKDNIAIEFSVKNDKHIYINAKIPPQKVGVVNWIDKTNYEGLKTILRTMPIDSKNDEEQAIQLEKQEDFIESTLTDLNIHVMGKAYVTQKIKDGIYQYNVYLDVVYLKFLNPKEKENVVIEEKPANVEPEFSYPDEFIQYLDEINFKIIDHVEDEQIPNNIIPGYIDDILTNKGRIYEPMPGKTRATEDILSLFDSEIKALIFKIWSEIEKKNIETIDPKNQENNEFEALKTKTREIIAQMKPIMPNPDMDHVLSLVKQNGCEVTLETVTQLWNE